VLAVEGCIWVRILLGFIGLARVMSWIFWDGPVCFHFFNLLLYYIWFKNIVYGIAWPNLTTLPKCLGGRKGPSLHISTCRLRNIAAIRFFLKKKTAG